ncbi:MAG TPA: M36 family metallopeptidase, partial [Pyrinomonadaceae bacterium]|nr:M36 family metallopeptidase [Pyrinomonadaceae bacterium]
DAAENVDGLYASGGYVTKNYYYGIRRFPYAVRSTVGANGKPHNPTTFADIDPAQIDLSDGAFPPAFVGAANEVHNIGDVWCNILLEVRANLIHSLGFAVGNPRAIQLVTDGMKMDPVNPTFIDARDSILEANCAGFSGANELDIWQGFKVHGMGFRAGYRLGTDGTQVFENFDGPNLTLETVTPTETIGNGNGQFDPGETVSLSIPLANNLCATDAVGATAALSTGGNANYGTIVHGSNGTQAISVLIPTNTACGSVLPITITVNSTNLGPIIYTYNLPIGQASALSSFENFDGVTAPNLPSGWTTSHTGASLGWVTSTSNPDSAPNSATSTNPANAGTGSLTSPAIPVDTALGRLSFRNLYNLEDGFDSMILAIQIDSGAFQEITTAGGSFVTGGYNSGLGWTGLSAGTTGTPAYITTLVNLPAAAAGHVIRLRWIVIGDPAVIAPGQAGVSIDSIQLSTTAQSCSPFGVATVSLGGRITDGSAVGIGGVQVTLSGSTSTTTTTNSTGNYNFGSIVSGGNYTVTPTTATYEYTPPNRVFNNLTSNVTNADFTAIPAAGISGRVTGPNGQSGIDGITMTLSGSQAAVTTTAGGGFYSFSPLTRFGNYTVTPSGGNNNTFTPPSRTYNNLNAAVTDANFVASENLTCTAIGSPIAGSIAGGDTTQVNRLFRDGVASTCANKTFPGESAAATIRYDTHTFVNSSGNTACIKVSLAANFAAHSVAYLNSYDPANKATNYLGDLGIVYPGNNSTATYTVNVPAGATYVIVVTETAVGAGGNYTLSLCESTSGVPTPPPAALPGQVLITEFRQSVGATTSSNEYVELYNNTDAPISVGGFGLTLFNANFGGDVTLGFPAGVTIPRRGHLIVANVAAGGYSLSGYASPDLSHANANLMPDNQGFGLINASRSAFIDSVGFVGNSGNQPYIEGAGLRTTSGARPNVEHAWVRRINPATNQPLDTGDNSTDFQLVSVTGAAFTTTTTPILSILGAPGPENAASPVDRSAVVRAGLVDPTSSSNGGENRKRFLTCGVQDAPPCPQDPNTSTFGYLSIRRKFTNNSGASVTRLRFRIIDTTTLNSPGAGGGQADIRALTSGQITVMINGIPTVIEGTTLETPPTQALGGGVNSSLSAGTITLGTPLANGQLINLQFMLGVQQGGTYRFFLTVEALP